MEASRPASLEMERPLKISGRGPVADVVASSRNDLGYGASSAPEDQPVCWICLDYGTPTAPLIQPCKCPRQAHSTCVARWQLQSAGTRKETHCEFCDEDLPDWKKTLTPQCGANAPAVMNVNFNDRTFSFEVKPGPDGYKNFTEAIRKAFGLPEDSELNITFTCDEPISAPAEPGSPLHSTSSDELMVPTTPVGSSRPIPEPLPSSPITPTSASLLTLQGAGAYDAAVHCASVSAAKRLSQHSPASSVSSQPQMPSPLQPRGPPFPSPIPSLLPQTQPYSNIPGFSQHYPSQSPPPYRLPQVLPTPPLSRTFGSRQSQPFTGFATQIPHVEEPRLASVPRRNSTNNNFLQRAHRAVKQGLRGGRKDRDEKQ